jgi:hypothetical protein
MAKEYDQKLTMHQVKYLGLLENVRVRRSGFAFRQVGFFRAHLLDTTPMFMNFLGVQNLLGEVRCC